MCGIAAIIRARRRRNAISATPKSSSQTEEASSPPPLDNEGLRRQLLALAKRGPTVISSQKIKYTLNMPTNGKDVSSSTLISNASISAFTSPTPAVIRHLIGYDPADEVTEKRPLPEILSHVGVMDSSDDGYNDVDSREGNTVCVDVTLIGAVLHLRGDGDATKQPYPLPDASSNLSTVATEGKSDDEQLLSSPSVTFPSQLCWNGEVFGGFEEVPKDASDTVLVHRQLAAIEESVYAQIVTAESNITEETKTSSTALSRQRLLLDAFRAFFESHAFEGPYAFIYNASSRFNGFTIFGRDYVGRRSLVVRRRRCSDSNGEEFIISSVACDGPIASVENGSTAEGDTSVSAAAEGSRTKPPRAKPEEKEKATAEWETKTRQVAANINRTVESDPLSWLSAAEASGAWVEVPTTGIFGVSVGHPSAGGENSNGDAAPPLLFLTVLGSPWQLENRVHPLLTHIPRGLAAAVDASTSNTVDDNNEAAKGTMWCFTLPKNKVYPYYPYALREMIKQQEANVPAERAEAWAAAFAPPPPCREEGRPHAEEGDDYAKDNNNNAVQPETTVSNEIIVSPNTDQPLLHFYGYPSFEAREALLQALVGFPMGIVDFSTRILNMIKYKHNDAAGSANSGEGGGGILTDAPYIASHLYLVALLDAVARRVDGSTRKNSSGVSSSASASALSSSSSSSFTSRMMMARGGRGSGGVPSALVTRDQVSSVMVMLSGGIDSTVLAALTHYALPDSVIIECVNVAFVGSCHDAESALTPDRIAAYQAFEELMALPGAVKRRWRFVEVNVCPSRLLRHKRRVLSLVSPRGTVMDHDIGCALWFAAQGVGLEIPTEDVLDRAQYFRGSGGDGAAAEGQQQQSLLSNKLVRRANTAVAPATTPTAATVNATMLDDEGGKVGSKRPRAEGEEEQRKGFVAAAAEPSSTAKSSEAILQERYGALIAVLQNEGFEAASHEESSGGNNPARLCKLAPMNGGGASSYDYCRGDDYHLHHSHKQQFSSVGSGASDCDASSPTTDSNGNNSFGVPKKVMLPTLGKEYSAVLTPVWKDRLGYKKLGLYLNDAHRDGVIHFGSKAGVANSQYVQLARPCDIAIAHNRITERKAVCTSPAAVPFTCQSRVVIMGMGADETLGGYVRHERLSAQHGWDGLRKELQSDFERLWERNLGRDDRVISDSGREARFPFLDERVLYAITVLGQHCPTAVCEFKGALPPNMRPSTTPTTAMHGPTGSGIGDKKILRTVARMIGLPRVSTLQKRAVQFGSRIADPKQRGSAALD